MLLSAITELNPIKVSETTREYLALIHKEAPFEDNFKLIAPDCFCGIEVEVENIKNRVLISNDVWLVKGDNSLRNNGLEFISMPVKGRDLTRSLELLFRVLPEYAQFSPRTSIHVHVNVLDLDVEQAERFLILYLLFEKLLYRFVGRDRDHNVFCVPLQDTYRIRNMIENFRYRLSRGASVEGEEYRYAGLNLACLFKFGTFEFRQLGGTKRVDQIVAWVNMLQSLRNHSMVEDYRNVIMELNTTSDYRAFLYLIFGDIASNFDLSFVDRDMERGVYAVKHALVKKIKYTISEESDAMKYMQNFEKELSLEQDVNIQDIFFRAPRPIPQERVVVGRAG